MTADEVSEQKSQELLQKLGHMSWRQGVGASVWARAAQDELARHEEARSKFANGADREWFERFHSTAYLAVVAVEQVLAFQKRVRKLTGDDELNKARRAFDARSPHAEAIRDLVVHFDAYAVGEGHRQRQGHQRPIADRRLSTLIYWTDAGQTYVNVGREHVDLHAIVEDAIRLAEVVERS